MSDADTVVWQTETSVWFQQVTVNPTGTFTLRREYARDPVDISGPAPSSSSLKRGGATLIDSRRDERRPSVDLYELRSQRQLALIVLGGSAESGVRTCFRAVGELLANVHRSESRGPRRAFHLGRFRENLELMDPGSPSSRLRTMLHRDALEDITRWLDDVESPDLGVPSVGNAAMSSIFLDETGGVEMTYGPEACTARPEFDVGWLLGELTELEYSFAQRGLPSSHIPDYARTLLDSYTSAGGPRLDLGRLARVVAIRVCLHYFDFAETMPTIPIGAADVGFLKWLIERARAMEDQNARG